MQLWLPTSRRFRSHELKVPLFNSGNSIVSVIFFDKTETLNTQLAVTSQHHRSKEPTTLFSAKLVLCLGDAAGVCVCLYVNVKCTSDFLSCTQ